MTTVTLNRTGVVIAFSGWIAKINLRVGRRNGNVGGNFLNGWPGGNVCRKKFENSDAVPLLFDRMFIHNSLFNFAGYSTGVRKSIGPIRDRNRTTVQNTARTILGFSAFCVSIKTFYFCLWFFLGHLSWLLALVPGVDNKYHHWGQSRV